MNMPYKDTYTNQQNMYIPAHSYIPTHTDGHTCTCINSSLNIFRLRNFGESNAADPGTPPSILVEGSPLGP